jgi:hypothetical protein
MSGGLHSAGWGHTSDPALGDVFAHLYPSIPHLRLQPARTGLMLEARSDDLAPDFTGMALHAARGTMMNRDTPASNPYPPHPWLPEAATNIHGGTFVGGNVNNIQRTGDSGAPSSCHEAMLQPLTVASL